MSDIDTLLDHAVAAARGSPNLVRKVGAVLITADGTVEIVACNTFPAGVVATAERAAGDNRFIWMEHAERNALFEAARRGVATAGATLLSTYFPCTDCARAIVQTGVKALISPRPEFDDPVWGASFRTSAVILEEGAVQVRYLTQGQAEIHDRILGS
ncbi:MAG TPA: deaminase [Vineibacter sp.]|nr:deaminase [Vineibacter sp.]